MNQRYLIKRAQKKTNQIDPRLRVIRRYKTNVFQVEKDGKPYVLKTDWEGDLKSLDCEFAALMNLESVSHTPDFEDAYYRDGTLHAILKTFIPGKNLEVFYRMRSQDLYQGAMDLVGEIHAHDVFRLDIGKSNIIRNDAGIFLFDFDYSHTSENKPQNLKKEKMIEWDLKDMKHLFGR